MSFQSSNHENRPLCLQPRTRPSISTLRKYSNGRKDDSLLLNVHVNRGNQTLAIHSNKFPENVAGICLVGISQVDKYKPV